MKSHPLITFANNGWSPHTSQVHNRSNYFNCSLPLSWTSNIEISVGSGHQNFSLIHPFKVLLLNKVKSLICVLKIKTYFNWRNFQEFRDFCHFSTCNPFENYNSKLSRKILPVLSFAKVYGITHIWRPWKLSNFQNLPPPCSSTSKILAPIWPWSSNFKRNLHTPSFSKLFPVN